MMAALSRVFVRQYADRTLSERAAEDPVLLEAMREVDAMLPETPPIAPRELHGDERMAHDKRRFDNQSGPAVAMRAVDVPADTYYHNRIAAPEKEVGIAPFILEAMNRRGIRYDHGALRFIMPDVVRLTRSIGALGGS